MASLLVQDSVSDQTLPSSAVRQNRALSSVLSENACADSARPQKDTVSQRVPCVELLSEAIDDCDVVLELVRTLHFGRAGHLGAQARKRDVARPPLLPSTARRR
jgi:hypothetical protein